jgi:MFS family permease
LTFSRLGALWGLKGVYAGITTIIVLMSFGLRHLPRGPLKADPGTAPAQSANHSRATITAALMLAAFFAFSLRDTLAWAFLERIGLQVGYSSEEVGNLLSIQAMFGIVGPLAASIVGSRFGLKAPLTIGILLSGLVTFAISRSSGSQWMYTLATTFQPCTYFFTLAYLTALAAELDPQGRVVAGSGSALMAGVAIGPAVGGALIVLSNGYTSVGWAIIACVSATFLFSLLPILAAQPSKRGQH